MCERSFASLSDGEIQEITEMMYPGCVMKADAPKDAHYPDNQHMVYPKAISEDGFLLPGEDLKAIVKDDMAYLEQVNITVVQIADTLEKYTGWVSRARNLYYEATGNSHCDQGYSLNSKYKGKVRIWMGAQECPFQDKTNKSYYGFHYGNADVTIEDIVTGKSITYNTLLPHMIRHHSFFESPNVKYRVSPKEIIDFFNLKPGGCYKAQTKTEICWRESSSSTGIRPDEFQKLSCMAELMSVSTHHNENVYCYVYPCSLETWDETVISAVKLEKNLNTKERYAILREKLLSRNAKKMEDYNSKYTYQNHVDTPEEIQTQLKKELSLIDLYTNGGHLYLPDDRNVCMNALVIRKNLVSYDKNVWNFTVGNVQGKLCKFVAFCFYRACPSTFTPLEKEMDIEALINSVVNS